MSNIFRAFSSIKHFVKNWARQSPLTQSLSGESIYCINPDIGQKL